MNSLIAAHGVPSKLVHGAARGADMMADKWGRRLALEIAETPADWATHGRAAGPIRNAEMLARHKVGRVVAFPGGNGTADMVSKARSAGIDVTEIKPR
jgi:hypothetical protein